MTTPFCKGKIRHSSDKFYDINDEVLTMLENTSDDTGTINESNDTEDANSVQADEDQNTSKNTDGILSTTDDILSYESLKQGASSRELVNASLVSTDVSDFRLAWLYYLIEREVRRIEKLEGNERNDPVAELGYFVGNIGYICEYEE